MIRGELGQQDGGARNAAVIELHRGDKEGDPDGVDHPRRQQKEEIHRGKFPHGLPKNPFHLTHPVPAPRTVFLSV